MNTSVSLKIRLELVYPTVIAFHENIVRKDYISGDEIQ